MKKARSNNRIQEIIHLLFLVLSFVFLIPPLSFWDNALFSKYDVVVRGCVIFLIGIQALELYW